MLYFLTVRLKQLDHLNTVIQFLNFDMICVFRFEKQEFEKGLFFII